MARRARQTEQPKLNPNPRDPHTRMTQMEFLLQVISDPRLAPHATSALPAWLWSPDGQRIFWANAIGARWLGAANAAELAKKTFGPADLHRRQVAWLAGRLPLT